MVKFIEFNANPWKQNVDDCVVRAISMAIGMRYKDVCHHLGVKYRNGYGLMRSGISLETVKQRMNSYFRSVVDVIEDFQFTPDDASQEDLDIIDKYDDGDIPRMTVSDFGDLYAGTGTYILNVNGNAKSKYADLKDEEEQHLVCLKCFPGKTPYIYDTFDSRDMIVNCYIQVAKIVPKGDPMHWKYDKLHNRMMP